MVSESNWGTWWRSWLRHCAKRRKIAGWIPDGVTGIFHCHNPFGLTTAFSSTQPLTEMTTTNISWGLKAIVLKSGSLNLLEPSGPLQACIGIALPLAVSSCVLRLNDPERFVIVRNKEAN